MSDSLTPEVLAELRRLDKAATPGPWTVWTGAGHPPEVRCDGHTPVVSWPGFDDSDRSTQEHEANAKLMALARNALPALLRERASLAADVEAIASLRTKVRNQRRELRRLNVYLRTFWHGVGWSHSVRISPTTKGATDANG